MKVNCLHIIAHQISIVYTLLPIENILCIINRQYYINSYRNVIKQKNCFNFS